MKLASTQVPHHTLKEIFDLYLDDYLKSPCRRFHVSAYHLHVLNTVKVCRTARIGLYYFGCVCCGDSHLLPRSCKSRFCSKCGVSDTMDWIKKITSKIPDIKHYHIVFTLPKELRSVCKRNRKDLYNLLFKESQSTIKRFFYRDHRLLPGIISVLHTNGSDLKYHPHIHQIVSSGGYNKSNELKELSEDFLVGQRRLADDFRDHFLQSLKDKVIKSQIKMPGHINGGEALNKLFLRLSKKQWIVNIESPLYGVEKVIAYVGRYTKKSCISERRIVDIADGMITLTYKDYKNGVRGEKPPESRVKLPVTEFLDRLLEHIPEKGFKVVRYYGIYSSYHIKSIPEDRRVKELNIEEHDLNEMEDDEIDLCPFKTYRKQVFRRTGVDPLYCYECKQRMKLIEAHYLIDGKLIVVEIENSD